MKRSAHPTRALVAASLAALAALTVAVAANAGPPQPTVPDRIQVEDGHKLYLVGHAVGVQIWRCAATPTGQAWTFVAPRADVFDDRGKLLMTHSAGPTWQARDGSKVVGQRVDGVNVDPTAIDWLLLRKASTSVGPDGDRLAGTTFIQRLATVGGIAPTASTCDHGALGSVEEVPYQADYTFWKASD